VKDSLREQFTIMPLFWIGLAILCGIVLASLLVLPVWAWFGLAFLALLIIIIVKRVRSQSPLLILLLPVLLLLGAARYQLSQPVITSGFISYYNEVPRRIYVTGTLAEPPDIRDTYMNLRIRVDAVDTGEGDIPVHGTLLVRLTKEYDLHYGDQLRVRGFIKTPPENEEFSYRDYLSMQGIHSILSTNSVTLIPFGGQKDPFTAFMYQVKDSLLKRVYALFPEPEASLLAGILLGQDNNIPAELQQAFKNTGTAHIIAISGFNIAIIAGIFVTLFSRFFGKRNGAILAILGVIFYTLLVGAGASVVRAAIMGTLSIIAAQFGRRNMALNTLAFVALVMAIINPLVLWDVGFQLSFMATLGLVLYAQPMQDAAAAFILRWLPSAPIEKITGPLSDYVLLTLAAQITTLPIIAYHFQRISLVSLIANPFILPAQPPLMILGGLAVVLSRLYFPLGQAVAWVAWPFPAYTIRMVEFFNGLPGAFMPLDDFSLLFVILFYVVLLVLTLAGSRLTKYRAVLRPAVSLSVLMVLTVLTWRSVLNIPDGRLHVTFLNVGSSDAVLVTTPGGKHVLVNGGLSPSQLSDQLGRRLPPFNRKLDYLVVASTQENEVAALPRTLERFQPVSALWAGNNQASFSSQKLDEWLTSHAVPLREAQTGDELDLGDGAKLRVLSVSSSGAILSVEWNNFRVILPIGVNFDMFNKLKNGKNLIPVTAVLLAQSGYAPANPPEWLTTLKADVVILSVAAGDPDGLPSSELLTALKDANLIRTDASGWIDLASDGQNTWITVERK